MSISDLFDSEAMRRFLLRGYSVETSYAEAKNVYMKAWSRPYLVCVYLKVWYANWHFTWLRRRISRPITVKFFGIFERILRAPFSLFISNLDKKTYQRDDFLAKPNVVEKNAIDALSTFLHSQEKYYDIYQGRYEQTGLMADGAPATIYVKTVDFVRSDAFWDIVTSPSLYDTCRNIMGKKAKITWAWLWYSYSCDEPYQNQNWHRDTGEPFNFVRVFVPLTPVKSELDGPTVVVKGSTHKEVLYERRRFTDNEVIQAVGVEDTVPALAEKGDVYFANTFCLHRGLPPQKPREMLSLLVSYQSSYRTKGLPLVPLSSFSEERQAYIQARKHFFREICDFHN